jgi:hypothetical protein
VKARNVHVRQLPASADVVGELVDEPARMWPRRWPPLRDDRIGFLRHEPLEHVPGRRRRFRITGPSGFSGWHGWDVETTDGGTLLRHEVEAECRGWVRLAWPLVIRPIHDALHEDVLDEAARAVGGPPAARPWPPRVRFLRWAIRKGGLARA